MQTNFQGIVHTPITEGSRDRITERKFGASGLGLSLAAILAFCGSEPILSATYNEGDGPAKAHIKVLSSFAGIVTAATIPLTGLSYLVFNYLLLGKDEKNKLDGISEENLYRNFQTILTGINRHLAAGEKEITIGSGKKTLTLSLADALDKVLSEFATRRLSVAYLKDHENRKANVDEIASQLKIMGRRLLVSDDHELRRVYENGIENMIRSSTSMAINQNYQKNRNDFLRPILIRYAAAAQPNVNQDLTQYSFDVGEPAFARISVEVPMAKGAQFDREIKFKINYNQSSWYGSQAPISASFLDDISQDTDGNWKSLKVRELLEKPSYESLRTEIQNAPLTKKFYYPEIP